MRDSVVVRFAVIPILSIFVHGCSAPTNASHDHATAKKNSEQTYAGDYPINVVCTTAQVADIVRQAGGPHVQVTSIMGPGVDPHLYRATPGDMTAFKAADMIFYNGMHLEGRLADVLVDFARRKPTFAVTKGLQDTNDPRLREPPEFEGSYDPHVWHDASIWSDCVRYVAAQLKEFDPSHAEDYQRQTDAYIDDLSALHKEAQQSMAAIPEPQRVLVTAHDAFGYFGEAYDIEVHGLQGISTVTEADIAGMEEAVELLTSRKIKAVFVESSVSDRNVEALIEACAAKGHSVTIGGELYSDAMGEAGTPEAEYTGMMRHNVNTISDALK